MDSADTSTRYARARAHVLVLDALYNPAVAWLPCHASYQKDPSQWLGSTYRVSTRVEGALG